MAIRYSKREAERTARMSVEAFLKGNRSLGMRLQKKAERIVIAKKRL